MALNDSRIRAAAVLANADSSLDILKDVARALGSDLVEAANDDALWGRLGAKPDGVDAAQWNGFLSSLNEDFQWEDLLPRVGYDPPPPAGEVAADIRAALAQGGDGERDVGRTRDAIRRLGVTLLAAANDPTPSRPGSGGGSARVFASSAAPLAITAVIGVAIHPFLASAAGAVAARGRRQSCGPVGP